MLPSNGVSVVLLVTLPRMVVGQFSNWQQNQINSSICVWYQPRAALVRDTVYLDGGTIWWSPGLSSGTIGPAVNEGNYQGLILSYNLTEPYFLGSNTTGILLQDYMSKARGGTGNGISSEPNYYDGGMLANDAEFFLYGGAVFRNDDLYDQPPGNAVLGYRRYQYGVNKPLWEKGFTAGHLDEGVNRYVAYGGPVNAPSENKAWYFSGLTSPTRGPIIYNTGTNVSTRAMNVSNTLITLDMSTQLEEKWTNTTLPDNIKGRANPEVVWVPVGKQGILVVVGGVLLPEWASVVHKSENETKSLLESSHFTSTIDIYDVASQKWFQQPSTGGPGAKARGCAVVATASDQSSFNIFYYGGFDGVHPAGEFSDAVWALSLPSFTWTLINNGTSRHARAGHKCFSPFPDLMMVFGGYTPQVNDTLTCLDRGPVVTFNLTSGNWMDSYDPARLQSYGVHEKIRAVIGGDDTGKATVKQPMPSGWAMTALEEVFSSAYDMKKITRYWPYDSSQPLTNTTSFDPTPSKRDSVLKIALPAVIIPVTIIIGTAAACFSARFKGFRQSGSSSNNSTVVENRRHIAAWLKGDNRESKQITLTESLPTSNSPDLEMAQEVQPPAPSTTATVPDQMSAQHEMEDTQLAELYDTSHPAELNDTSVTPLSSFHKLGGYFDSEHSFSPSDPSDVSRICTSYPADNKSVSSQFSGATQGDRHWVESPTLGPMPLFPPFAHSSSSFSVPIFQRSGSVIREEEEQEVRRDDRPISPTSSSEQLSNDEAPAQSIVSPLQITISNDDEYQRLGMSKL